MTAITGPPPAVVKRGPPRQLAREATALRRLSPLGLAPRLLDARPAVLTSELLPGSSRALDRLRPDDARALGALVRRVHDVAKTATGGLPDWTTRARSLAGYRRRRIADMLAAAGSDRRLAKRVVAVAGAASDTDDPRPFRFLHGDLASANILWNPAPALVDWEFWRMGDPAEDLAYLAEINALPAEVVAAIVAGYGHRETTVRIAGWRPLCALDIALWYRDRGDRSRMAQLTERYRVMSPPTL